MPEPRDTLDRLAARLPEREGLDGLDRRRNRHRRRQRLLAAVIALVIAAVGTTSLVVAFSHTTQRPAAEETLPDVARIECDGSTTKVSTPRVRPQPDGVHVEIESPLEGLVYHMAPPGGGGFGDGVDRGTTQITSGSLLPGRNEVACYRGLEDSFKDAPRGTFEVVDVDGLFVPYQLQCDGGGGVTGIAESFGMGSQEPPVDQATRRFGNKIRPDDLVEAAGYPSERNEAVRVVRDDKVVAFVEYWPAENGGWYEDHYSACQGF